MKNKEEHLHKYIFRLMYFVCTDGKVISDDTQMTYAYQEKKHCEHRISNRTTRWLWEDKTKPVPQDKIEGFFLVPEKLWWILAPFAKQFLIKDKVSPPRKEL
jgi:hypothetical protein